jgi:VWFA-related protein
MTAAVRVALASVLFTAPLFAQQPAPAPSFGETIEVRVVNVDVMVTDRNGKPVTGLTKDDFDLFEGGKKLEITNFAQMSGPAQTATLPPSVSGAPPQAAAPATGDQDARSRKVVLFIDNSSLQAGNRARVLRAAKDFVARAIRGTDQVMIVTWNPGLHVDVPFTNDVAVANAALEQMTATVSLGGAAERELQEVEHEIANTIGDYAIARPETQLDQGRSGQPAPKPKPPVSRAIVHAQAYVMRQAHEQREVVEALKSVIATIRSVEGRKAVVFITEQFDQNPGHRIFDFLEQIKDKFDGGQSVNYLAEAQKYREPEMINSIAALANGSGVALYPVHAGGLGADTGSNAADQTSFTYNTPSAMANAMNESFPAMQQLAAATGGVALIGTSNYALGFARVAEDLTSYYSLGFRTTGPRKDTVWSLTAKLKNPRGLVLRMRPQYIEKSPTSEMNDTVSANLFFPIAHNDLGVKLSAGTAQPGAQAGQISVPLDIKVPTSTLTLLPEGTDLSGRFSIYVAFVQATGATSKVTRQEQQVRFPADSLKRRKELTVRTMIAMDDKVDAVSVGVMDEASKATGFATLKLNAPPVASAAPSLPQ